MKFYLSTVLALLVATTSVSAACQRRRSTIPTTDVTADGTPADEMISTPEEKLVRRHKSGRRLRRDGPRAGSQGTSRFYLSPPRRCSRTDCFRSSR